MVLESECIALADEVVGIETRLTFVDTQKVEQALDDGFFVGQIGHVQSAAYAFFRDVEVLHNKRGRTEGACCRFEIPPLALVILRSYICVKRRIGKPGSCSDLVGDDFV